MIVSNNRNYVLKVNTLLEIITSSLVSNIVKVKRFNFSVLLDKIIEYLLD